MSYFYINTLHIWNHALNIEGYESKLKIENTRRG
jgi:C1A family cysteine protease